MPAAHRDPALDALLYPFDAGLLRWPERCLFLRAPGVICRDPRLIRQRLLTLRVGLLLA